MASTDVHGQFAGIPVVVQVVNAVNNAPRVHAQADGQQCWACTPDAWMPDAGHQRFRWSAAEVMSNRHHVATNGQRTPGKVALFATCFVNYNEPGIGHDLLKLLEHNHIPYEHRRERKVLRHAQAGTGRPGGGGRCTRQANIPVLARYAKEGYAIVSAPVPAAP